MNAGPEHPESGTGGEVGPGSPRAAPAPAAGPALPRRPRRVFLVVGLAVAAALAVGLFTSAGGGGKSSAGGRPGPGSPAPTFTLPRLGGPGTVGTPADGGGHGRPAVLLFFASWCGPCHAELPDLAAAVRHQEASGGALGRIAFIGVDTIDPTSSALAFVHRSGVTFPVAEDTHAEVFDKYQIPGDPVTVYITGAGRIAHIGYGPTSPSELAHWEHQLVTD